MAYPSEYPSPNTVSSSGQKGDLVVDLPTSKNLMNRALGIPYAQSQISQQETSSADLPQTPHQTKVLETPFNLDDLKKMISDPNNKVKIRPILLALSGLVGCGKSNAIQHLLRHYVEESPYMPMSRKGYIPTTTAQGITFYELLAYGIHQLRLTEVTNEFSFAFGIMSAFKKTMLEDKVVPHFPTERGNRESKYIFEDSDLESHLEYVFRHISQFEHIPKSTKLTKEEERFISHLKRLPDGTSIMNIWDVTITSTSATHYLDMLSGHLYNSNTWLFLDIERDLYALDDPLEAQPSANQQQLCTEPQDTSDHNLLLLNKWRPRLHYLLRASKVSHGGKKCDRKDVCTIFAGHSNDSNHDQKVEELERKIQQAARQIGVAQLIESKIQSINLSDKESSQRLYQKFQQVICNAPYEDIPLSWIFLRSLFYRQRQKFISKTNLESKAKECGIEGGSFDKFCRFFASFGSIIDFTLINPDHKLVVFQPIDFLRSLDNLLNPKDDTLFKEHPMTRKGIISETICQQIFEVSCSDYMSALISINLASRVTGLCVKDEIEEEILQTDTLYYVPQMRLSNSLVSTTDSNPSAAYLITSIDSPPISKHAKFVKHMLSINPKLNFHLVPCSEINKTILIDILSGTHVTFITFSSVTRIEISEINDEIYTIVVKTCHELTKPHETGIVKYQFVMMCATNSHVTPSSLLSCHSHVLPTTQDLSCKPCHDAGYFADDNIKAWNRVLEQNPAPVDCHIQSGLTFSQLCVIAEEFELYPKFIPDLMHILKYTEDHPKLEGMEGGKLVMEMLLDWNKGLKPSEEENQRKGVAKSLLSKASPEDKTRFDFFLKIAKEFDYYAKFDFMKKTQY